MADLKISQLPSTIAPSLSDLLPIVNQGSTKKVTLQELQTFLGTAAYTTTVPNPVLKNNNYLIDARSLPKAVTLPLNPTPGSVIGILALVAFAPNVVTVYGNGKKINNLLQNLTIDYSCSLILSYINASEGWLISNVFEL